MTNHVHLLLTPKQEDSAAMLMKNLGQRYVQFINRTYQRNGTLHYRKADLDPVWLKVKAMYWPVSLY